MICFKISGFMPDLTTKRCGNGTEVPYLGIYETRGKGYAESATGKGHFSGGKPRSRVARWPGQMSGLLDILCAIS